MKRRSPMAAKKVFISYNHDDRAAAERLKTALAERGLHVIIDNEAMRAGEGIEDFIKRSVREADATLSLVSNRSLLSAWVALESITAFYSEKLQDNKNFIPCYLDDDFFQPDFRVKATERIDARIAEINQQIPKHLELGIDLNDLSSEHARLHMLRANLGVILKKLKESLTLDVREPQFENSLKRIVKAIEEVPSGVEEPSVSDRRKIEEAYLERLRQEELQDREKYTPMGGASRVEMRAKFEHKPFQLAHLGRMLQKEQDSRKFENAVEEILRLRRAVLLGEPGAGKTTTLWKLAGDLMESAGKDTQAPIPLLIRLGRWTDADQPFEPFIASQLGDLGRHLDSLLAEKRAALLLDGLNELPVGQREKKYPQVQQLIEKYSEAISVISCRELDYTVDLGFDRINIMPLDPQRIREFVVRYLEKDKGEALFLRLVGGEGLRKVWEKWQRAGASFELFWTAPEIPRENPNVYGATSGEEDRIWQEKFHDKHSLMELARNPFMLWMLTSVYADLGELPENRGELFRLFVETLLHRERIPKDEQSPLTDGLAKIAYAMQIRRTDGVDGDALTVLPRKEVAETLGERLLYLAGSASILSVGDEVRFTHQLLQEYFAAKYMDQEIQAGRLKAVDLWPAEKWWERTNWEEAAKLLAGLYSNDCTPIVEWIAEANPEVAAQCVKLSGAGLAEATRERLRAQWIPRLIDLKGDPDPKARAAIGRALGLTGWDNRKGVDLGPDGLPDFDWVEIPGGDFQYGESNPPQKLTLPTFYIARYPVTYVQFQAFLDDPQGYADPKWFAGLAADESDRRMDEQWFKYANHPRETVNWYQAMAFCRWLSWRIGGEYDLKKIDRWKVRLPTEFEWEKAARGTDGRLYPYQGDFDPLKANTSESEIGQTTAVGIYPNGASPYGVMDMSGNAWEWCLSRSDKPAKEARKEKLTGDDIRVLRGGSWLDYQVVARAVVRLVNVPDSRNDSAGFRVVLVGGPPPL